MLSRFLPALVLASLLLADLALVFGQNLAIDAGPVPNPVQRIATAQSPSVTAARQSADGKLQIRVTVQYLLVDDETRDAIYGKIDHKLLKTTLHPAEPAPRAVLDGTTSPLAVTHHVRSPSRVTCCALDELPYSKLISSAAASPLSQVDVAPKIILLDGNEVEMTDFIQRPFVVDFQLEGETVAPKIQVLDEGTRLRLVGNLSDPNGSAHQSIELQCELSISRVLDVHADKVYGLGEEPLGAQVPVQQTTSAVVSHEVKPGQTLLIDPHVRQSKVVQNETGVPMLGKLPYVGRTFKNVERAEVSQHMLLLLQPHVEPMAR